MMLKLLFQLPYKEPAMLSMAKEISCALSPFFLSIFFRQACLDLFPLSSCLELLLPFLTQEVPLKVYHFSWTFQLFISRLLLNRPANQSH